MKKTAIIFSAFLAILLTACSEVGIFYSLENEEEILESNNLNNATNFSNMVQAGNFYIGNAGKDIFFRSTDNSNATVDDWHTLSLPTGANDSVSGSFSSDIVVSSMVLVGSDLIISMISYDDADIVSGIYRLAGADSINFSAADNAEVESADWEMLVKTAVTRGTTDASFYSLFEANGNLYVNLISNYYSSTDDYYPTLNGSTLYFVNDVTTIANDLTNNSTVIDISGFAKDADGNDMIASVEAISSSGSNYWMIINGESAGSVYYSTDGSTFNSITSTLTDSTTPVEASYVDVFAVDATRVLISNMNGSLYIYNGSTFRELTKGSNFLNGFENISGTLATDTILVGTTGYTGDSTYDGTGYAQLSIAGDDSAWDWIDSDSNFSDLNNYNSSELSDASINGFLYDPTNERIFAYTSNAGVWMNDIEDSTRVWSLE